MSSRFGLGHQSLQTRILIALVVISLFPLGLVSLSVAMRDRQALTDDSSRELRGLARGLAHQIDDHMDNLLGTTAALAAIQEIVTMDPATQGRVLKEMSVHFDYFDRLSTFDVAGTRLASSTNGGITSVADRASFQAMLATGEPAWEVARRVVDERPSLLIFAPIRNESGDLVGALDSIVDMERMSASLADIEIGAHGQAFVLDRTGRILMHGRPELVALQPEVPELGEISSRPSGTPGAVRFKNSEQAFLAGHAPVGGTGWTFFVVQPEDDVLESAAGRLRLTALGLAVSAGLVLVVGLLLAGALTRPVRQLAVAARAFSAGDSSAPLPPDDGRDGEIGVLVSAFAEMRDSVSQALGRVQESEERFRRLAENAPDVIFRYELQPQPHFGYMNPAAEEMFGRTPESFYSDPELLTSLAVPAYRAKVHALIRGVDPEDESTIQFQCSSGEPTWVAIHVSPVADAEGAVIAVEGIGRDITEQKRAAVGLAQLAAIVASSIDSIISTDLEGKILSWNASAERLYGYSAEEAIGQSINIIAAPGDELSPMELLERVTPGQRFDALELRRVRKDGQVLDVAITISPIRDTAGNVVGTSKITRDISRSKQAEVELMESHAQLENALAELKVAQDHIVQQERLHAIGQMASGIAHDFNNALSPILGITEILLARPEMLNDTDQVRAKLELMNTASKDAAAVVRRLREFYRVRDRDDPDLPVDLQQVIAEAISMTQPRWKDQSMARGATMAIHTLLEPLPPLTGNATELRELLVNLIFNAVDAMPRGGDITISTHLESGYAVLEVADTGAGMSEETRLRCLEPFFSTKGEHGTGLGLAMVHGIARRHGARVRIESIPGEGTRIQLLLPISRESASTFPLEPHPAQPAARVATKRILVVDDEPQVRRIVAEFLELEDDVVVQAASGLEALRIFEQDNFDAVITDRAMPEMNGDQLAIEIKRMSASTPVILLTGFGDLMLAGGARPEGVDLVLAKPITIKTLRQGVEQAIEKHQRVAVAGGLSDG